MTREELEARVAELEHLNHRLANQIAGYGDRMQETIGGIIRDAIVEALRLAAEAIVSWESSPLMCLDECGNPNCRDDIRIDQVKGTATWLRTRADNLEKP